MVEDLTPLLPWFYEAEYVYVLGGSDGLQKEEEEASG